MVLSNKRSSSWEPVISAFVSIAGFIAVWYVLVILTDLRKVMPLPNEVFKAFFGSIVAPIGQVTLPVHILVSLKRVFIGYFLACAIGIPMGILMGCSRTGEAFIRPIFELLRPIPGLAWIPLAILWFGIGESPKYYIICVSAVVSILLNSYSGAKNVDNTLLGAARILGAKESQIFYLIRLPSAVPQIFAGLQIGLSSSWMAVIAAEMIRSDEGIGWVIITGMESGNTVQILIGMVSIGLTGLVLASLLRRIETILCAWNERGR